jgi:hypothetical protein
MPREHAVDNLRDDGLIVSQDAGEKRLPLLQLAEQVPPHLLLDGDRLIPGFTKLAKGAGSVGHRAIKNWGSDKVIV